MPEQLLSSKSAAQKQTEQDALSKATGVNYNTPTPTTPVGQQSPQETSPMFKAGTDIAGTKVKLADGTDYTMKGASSGTTPVIPTPTTPTTPTPTVTTEGGNTAVTTPTTSSSSTIAGIDTEALKRSGLSAEEIQKIVDLATPKLAAEQSALDNAGQLKDLTIKNIEEEAASKDALYTDMASQDKALADQKQKLIDDSAALQAGQLEQAKAVETLTVEQDKAKFDLARTREERSIQDSNMKNEEQTSRAIASSLGMAFGSYGIARVMDVRQRGEAILSDARAQTAIGAADYTIRLADIERNYGKDLNQVETSRRDLQIQNLTTLNDQLQAIDEKKLLSVEEKKDEANAAIKEFLGTTDKINDDVANILTGVVEGTQKKAQALIDEKKANEVADLDMSASYGYFVNKWGKPVNTQLNGQPTPFVGTYNKDMSEQFGYLVDSKGNAIRDNKGNKISFTDPSMAAFQNALKAYSAGGELSEDDKATLNGKVGSNAVIGSALESGRYYPSKSFPGLGLQCGEYINDQFLASRQLGSDFANADKLIKQFGGKPGAYEPNVGDVVFIQTKDKNVPHKAIVEGKDKNGNLIITDSNWIGNGVVSHGRVISKESSFYKNIYGFASLPLKKGVILGQPTLTTNTSTDGPSTPKTENERIAQELMLMATGAKAGVSSTVMEKILNKNKTTDSSVTGGSFDDFLSQAAGVKASDAQRKAAGFLYQAMDAENQFKAYENAGVPISTLNTTASRVQPIPFLQQLVPMNELVQNIQNPRERDVMSARLNWVVDVLRPASGASINLGEYESTYSQYFPGPTATAPEIKNAANRRQKAIDGLAMSTGTLGPMLKKYMAGTENSYEVAPDQAAPVSKPIEDIKNTATDVYNKGMEIAGQAKETIGNTANDVANTAQEYYGYVSDVAKETIDEIKSQYPSATEDDIRKFLNDNNVLN